MLKRNFRAIISALVLCTDLLALLAAGISAYALRQLLPSVSPLSLAELLRVVGLLACILLLVALVFGLYRSSICTSPEHQLYLAWRVYGFSILLSLSLFYLFGVQNIPRRFVILFFAVLPAWFALGRMLLSRLIITLQRKGYSIFQAIIYGYEDGWDEVLNRFQNFPELGYVIKGIVVQESRVERKQPFIWNGCEIPVYPRFKLPWLVEQEKVDTILIPSPRIITNGSAALLPFSKRSNIKLRVVSPESDRLLKSVHVHDLAGVPLYIPSRRRFELFRMFTKRIIDLLGATLLILILSPIMLFTAIAILLESGRPILFVQKRSASKNGKAFDFYKFRSMQHNADALKDQLYLQNEADGALFKLRKDPRLTAVGRFIRRYSIDELPQLFNVLKGDMSLVGPRPLPVKDFEKLDESPEFWEVVAIRERVKPGITGLWQISGRSTLGFQEMLLLDCYYVENQSIFFDIAIMIETVLVVLTGKGAY